MQRVSDVRRVPVTILLLLIALHVSSVCSAQQASLQVTSRTTVSSIERFYGLSQNEARSGLPVRIEGTVLYSDPHWHLFWLKDETGRLFIPLPPEVEVPPARTRAIVTGTTTFKDGNYRIEGLKIQRTGPSSLPAPRPLMPLKLDDQKRLEDRVSVTGTIIEAEV